MAIQDVASPSAGSKVGSSSIYDVFLSFRGEDTRNNFISFLHRSLTDRGINAFLDSKELWVGEGIGPTLLKAIRGSMISIPVFSNGYAESKWCLRELAMMVDCYRSNDQIILPIFFDVDPSDVRHQTRSFENAFLKHNKRYDPREVEAWKEALNVAGNLKGVVVSSTDNLAECIEDVVHRALCELTDRTRLAENDYLIDMDSRVKDLLSLLNIASDDVLFVGIWGFGGIGKTTLAKAVYNIILSTFDKHCFLSDIREHAAQFNGLLFLQNQFLKEIFKGDFDIQNLHRGKQLIEERVCNRKVFLVLDDVDNKDQIDALAGRLNWFGPGSKVLITTRDEHVLNVAKVDKKNIYKPPELDHNQSLTLFSLHAFGVEQPPESFLQLSENVATYSGGLPLTLEVLGSWLSDTRNRDEWKSTLQELKEIPHSDVQKRLRISYDNLKGLYLKEIFLDAACFFIGWEKEVLISIWQACGYNPRSAIPRLIQRSLITFEVDHISKCAQLKMHDQIRDMGRGIVLEENPMDLSKRNRLWSRDDILQVLDKNTGTNMITSLILHTGLSDVCLHQHHFEMMPNLRFLDITSESVNGNFCSLPSMLKWFRWTKCPWDIISTNFYHKGLVYLKLSGFSIVQGWSVGPRDVNKRFQNLKVLDLSHCDNLSKSPNFSWFPSLEHLDLSYCPKLESLDESIGQLSGLKYFNLSFTSMKELPDNVSKLSSLNNLKLVGCSALKKLPEFIGDLKILIELNLDKYDFDGERENEYDIADDDFEGIEELPDSVGLLENLEVLSTSGCSRLLKLPRSMGRMMWRLHTLNLISTNISKLPEDFSMLSKLEVLKMSWNLKFLPIDFSHLGRLRRLDLWQCKLLEELPEVSLSLVELRLYYCDSLVRTCDISRLQYLTVLKLRHCENLKEIQGLEGTKSLDYIEVINCHSMTDTKRNIHGQGTLRLPEMSQKREYHADDWANCKGLILSIIFRFVDDLRIKHGEPVSVSFGIRATIHQKDKATEYVHTLRFEDVEYTSGRDTICLHRFDGVAWFGSPLQGKDSIVIEDIWLSEYSKPAPLVGLELKFWELSIQKPIFSLYNNEERKGSWSEFGSVSEVVEVEEETSRVRNNEEDEASAVSSLDQIMVANGSNSDSLPSASERTVLDHVDDEAAVVDHSRPEQHHNSTSFLKLICSPFTLLFSPGILWWGWKVYRSRTTFHVTKSISR